MNNRPLLLIAPYPSAEFYNFRLFLYTHLHKHLKRIFINRKDLGNIFKDHMNPPIIILVRPQLQENIGAVARAMLNFNISELRLVEPLVDHLDHIAIRISAGADVVLENAQIFSSLEDATADLETVIGTIAEPRDMVYRYTAPKSFFEHNTTHKTGIVFGPERTGLTNEDILFCPKLIMIPTNVNFSSLNIAQAVLVICYEWFQSQDTRPASFTHYGATVLATQDHRHILYKTIEQKLDAIQYWRVPSKKEIMWQNFRAFLNRIELTHQDIQTLLGMLKK
jgi:tRNA/rRNA methyltransferase